MMFGLLPVVSLFVGLWLFSAGSLAASYNFEVTAVSGDLISTQATGTFSYSAPEGQTLGLEFTAFDFTWDGVAYDETDLLIGSAALGTDGLIFGASGGAFGLGAFGSRCRAGGCQYGGNSGEDFVIQFGFTPGFFSALDVPGSEFFRYTRADGSSGLGTVAFELQE